MKSITKKNQIINLLITLLFISSCTVRIIAPYDEVTDEKVADMQENILLNFKKWEKQMPAYTEAESFYDQVEVTLEVLIERNEAIQKSDLIVNMLKEVQNNIKILRTEHEANRLSSAVIEEIYPDIKAQFNAIQRFQMSLKRAETKLK